MQITTRVTRSSRKQMYHDYLMYTVFQMSFQQRELNPAVFPLLRDLLETVLARFALHSNMRHPSQPFELINRYSTRIGRTSIDWDILREIRSGALRALNNRARLISQDNKSCPHC